MPPEPHEDDADLRPGTADGSAGSGTDDGTTADGPEQQRDGDATARAADATDRPAGGPADGGAGRTSRDVVVPDRVYKLVTVLSTAIAVPTVVLGFMFLDAATLQVSVMRRVVLSVLAALGLGVDTGTLSAVLALVGLLLIASGAGVYVLGARFRAAGMGNAE